MGFRNPLLEATDPQARAAAATAQDTANAAATAAAAAAASTKAVDTRPDPASAGVRAYEKIVAGLSRGTLEYASGITGVDPATLELAATALGNSFEMVGAPAHGVTAARLALKVDPDFSGPANSYLSRAAVTATEIVLTGKVQVTGDLAVATTPLLLPMATDWKWFGAGWAKPCYWRDANGTTNVQGFIQKVGTTSAAHKIAQLPAALAPVYGIQPTFMLTNVGTNVRVDVDQTGQVVASAFSPSIADGNYMLLSLRFHPQNGPTT